MRSLRFAFVAAVLCCAGCESARESPTLALVDATTQREALFVLYRDGGMRITSPGQPMPPSRQLIAAGWDDGLVVWRSGAPVDGRESLVASHVEPARASQWRGELFTRLERLAPQSFTIVDGSSHTWIVRDDDRRISVSSSHEVFEEDSRLVAVDGGIQSLDGRAREDVLAGSTDEWRDFRAQWALARAQRDDIRATIPEGELTAFDPERLQWIWK